MHDGGADATDKRQYIKYPPCHIICPGVKELSPSKQSAAICRQTANPTEICRRGNILTHNIVISSMTLRLRFFEGCSVLQDKWWVEYLHSLQLQHTSGYDAVSPE